MVLTTDDRERLLALLERHRIPLRNSRARQRLIATVMAASIVPPAAVPPHVVTMHSDIDLIDLEDGRSEIYRLVFPGESDFTARRISVLTPLGASLIGRSENDVVAVDGILGSRRFYISEVVAQPEAELRRADDTIIHR